jgi:hypothetical protein
MDKLSIAHSFHLIRLEINRAALLFMHTENKAPVIVPGGIFGADIRELHPAGFSSRVHWQAEGQARAVSVGNNRPAAW